MCRPAAFAHGGTDELTHCLGHTRVHLGLNMAATAVPVASDDTAENAQANSEDVVLYFGIIDILQVQHLMCCSTVSAFKTVGQLLLPMLVTVHAQQQSGRCAHRECCVPSAGV